jgi:uncharacterized protein YdeI (YjbR/CyaY-like superfamily)
LIVGFHRIESGTPSMTWPESVDEALCFGWIDGIRKRIDATSYQIRFTPRRPTSVWSAVNIAKMTVLEAEGRMQPAGRAAFALRKASKSQIYSYEQRDEASFTAAQIEAFRAEREAWGWWMKCPPWYRKVKTYWVSTAKQATTRDRRFGQLVAACAAGRRI